MRHSGPPPDLPWSLTALGSRSPPQCLSTHSKQVWGGAGVPAGAPGQWVQQPPTPLLGPMGVYCGGAWSKGPRTSPLTPSHEWGQPPQCCRPPLPVLGRAASIRAHYQSPCQGTRLPRGPVPAEGPTFPGTAQPSTTWNWEIGGGRDQVLHCPPAPPAAGAGVPLVMPIPGVSGQDGGMKEWMLGWMWAWTDGGWDGEGHGRVDAGMDGHMDKCTPSFCRTHRGPASPQEAPGDSWGCWGGLGPCC